MLNLIIAAIAGLITGEILHCKKDIIWDICIGLIGGIFGTFILGIFGIHGQGFIGSLAVSIIGSIIFVMIWTAVSK